MIKNFFKLKYLVLFLSCFCFVSNVSASVVSTPLKNIQIYSGNSTLSRADKTLNNIYFVGGYATNARFRLTFSNDFSNYSSVAFFIYDTATESNSNPNYDNAVPPLVILDGSACSVLPIGAEDQNDAYYYDGLSYATCEVTSPTNHNLEIFSLYKSSSYFIGVNDYWRVFDKEATLDDVITSVDSAKQSVDKVDDTLNNSDTTESQSQANSFFNNFQTDTYGLSDIITMPLTLIKSLTNSTCVSLDLNVPFVNKTLSLPCMSSIYSQYFGSFFSLYQLVTFGFVAYWVSVRVFNLVKDFKNPDHDEIEVLDL